MSTDQQLALARSTRGESSHLSRAARQVVPPFLQKLYEIVNDPKNDELIRWSENGDSFYVLNHERFAREVLGRWFKHQKFTSFVRQLNMYGFHKIPHLQQGVLRSETDTEPWHFEHPHFHRGQPDLLCLIQRKKQPPQAATDDLHMDMHEQAHMPPQVGNLTQGQVLDVNSIVNGIAAIKRHQQAISADLNELKSSNQHLWQEALAARERHKKHQDTINRILKFLAGVFGHGSEAVHHKEQDTDARDSFIQRKRPRLMIGDVMSSDKGKAATVEEVDDDDDRRTYQTAAQGSPMAFAPFASIETPEPSVHSPHDTGPFSPAASDISVSTAGPTASNNATRTSAHFSRTSTTEPSVRPPTPTTSSEPLSHSPPTRNIPSPPNPASASQPPPASNLPPASNVVPNNSSPEFWNNALQQIINSPNQMQRLMQALASQQAFPLQTLPDPVNGTPTRQPPPTLNGLPPPFMQAPTSGPLTPYGGSYDFTRFRTELPQPTAANGTMPPPPADASQLPHTISSLGSLIRRDDEEDGPTIDRLQENHDRYHRVYENKKQIDADVDALQYSLSSLIENLGWNPNLIESSEADERAGVPLGTSSTAPGAGTGTPQSNGVASTPSLTFSDDTDTPLTDPNSGEFDFDAFFNNDYAPPGSSSGGMGHGPAGGPAIMDLGETTARFDPVTQMDASGVDDAQAEQLTAFLDDVSETAGGSPEIPAVAAAAIAAAGVNGMGSTKKRKSDVVELPVPPLVTNGEAPKLKRRR